MRSNGLARVIAALAFTIGVFLLGAYVQSVANAPFQPASVGMYPLQRAGPVAVDAGVRADVPIVSRVQGAQDAARADVPAGAEVDMKRCVATMLARREPEDEAHAVCTKLISGMGGR